MSLCHGHGPFLATHPYEHFVSSVFRPFLLSRCNSLPLTWYLTPFPPLLSPPTHPSHLLPLYLASPFPSLSSSFLHSPLLSPHLPPSSIPSLSPLPLPSPFFPSSYLPSPMKERLELQGKATRNAAATCMDFPDNEVNKLLIGSEECDAYQAQRHGTKPGVSLFFQGHRGPISGISLNKAHGQPVRGGEGRGGAG